jgi:hypothetical protein
MDAVPEADSFKVYSCGGMEDVDKHSSGQYSFRFSKIVNLIVVKLETVELGLQPCSWLRVENLFIC